MSGAVENIGILSASNQPPAASRVRLDVFADVARTFGMYVIRAWHWLAAKRQAQISSKRLRVCEQVQLGEKRFVAILQVDKQQFLVGGSATGLSLLGQLETDQSFGEVFQKMQGVGQQ